MVKFICNKIGRDKGLKSFKAQNITPHYKLLTGEDLGKALKKSSPKKPKRSKKPVICKS